MPDFSSDFQKLFNGDNFKLTGPRKLTVVSVGKEEIGTKEKPQRAIVLRVKEDERGIKLNKTRYDSLTELFGSPDTDKWVGGEVEVYYDPSIKFGNQKKGGIAIRAATH